MRTEPSLTLGFLSFSSKVRVGAVAVMPWLAAAMVSAAVSRFPEGFARIIGPASPLGNFYLYLFFASYFQFIRHKETRELLLFATGAIASVWAFSAFPFLMFGAGVYLIFALALLVLLYFRGLRLSRSLQLLVFAAMGAVTVIVGKVWLSQYSTHLARPGVWEVVILGVWLRRIIHLFPMIYYELIKGQAHRKFPISPAALGSYLTNPAFMVWFIAVGPTEYCANLERRFQPRERIPIDTILTGWKLTFLGLLLTWAASEIWTGWIGWAVTSGLIGKGVLATVFGAFSVYATLTLISGLIMIQGIHMRDSFDGLWRCSNFFDFWRSWNVYYREWLQKYFFYPTLRVVRQPHIAVVWTFFINGWIHHFPFAFSGWHQFTKPTLMLWLVGAAYPVLFFFYRLTRRLNVQDQFAWVPLVFKRGIAWSLLFLTLVILAMIRIHYFPATMR